MRPHPESTAHTRDVQTLISAALCRPASRAPLPSPLSTGASEDDEYDPEEDAMSHQDLDATREDMRRADVDLY